ncbi:hypothetical protein MT349_02535 [Rathayibacter caricis]|uniref:hypothetical protein n=1 Tax=Rathayibacter caricis TaxID=110936 RepID=UPI001FB330AC|nr:hypothetical protein [Rathayibacter caricis]MCJ1694647.1 hypothetical protein [Rathayibacter caricis]
MVDNSIVTFEVTAHNAGDSPIYSASIAFFNKNDQYCFEAISPVSFPTVDMMLAPGESKFTAIPEPINPNTYDPIISFYDGNGQKWNRRLSDGSYRSHRWLEAWRTKQRQKTWLEAKLFDVRMELLRQKVAADRRARNNGTSP